MECKVCDKKFTGIESCKQHEDSEKHKKKMMLYLQNNGTPNNTFSTSSQVSNGSVAQNVNTLPCDICSKNFYSISDFMQHSASEEHANMVLSKKSEISTVKKERPVCSSTTNGFSMNGTGMDHFDSIGQWNKNQSVNPYYARCELCDKTFSGRLNYEQHIVSDGHRKKCASLSPNVSQKEDQNIIANEMLSSDVLDKTVNNSLSFQQCEENIDYRRPMLSESNSVGGNSNNSSLLLNSLICEICDMTFTGPIPHGEHMQSLSHMKGIKRKQLLSQMDVGKENMKTEAAADSSSKQPGKNLSNPWYCETCNKICSGPEPYRAHMVSEKHRKNVTRVEAECKQDADSSSKPTGKTFSSPWYCETCNKICSGPDPYRAHMVSEKHKKNVARAGAECKQNEIRNIMSQPPGEVDIFSTQRSETADFSMMVGNNAGWVSLKPDKEVKDSLLSETSTFSCAVDVSQLSMTFFKVGEEIDFDKKEKSDIKFSELEVNGMEEDDDEETTYDDMPSP